MRIPYAQANLARIPEDLTDEQCMLLSDIASMGISAAESANVQIGQTVAVFAQGPIGLCAAEGARSQGGTPDHRDRPARAPLRLNGEMGADETVDVTREDPVTAIKRYTNGRGVDVAIGGLARQETFAWCLEATRSGGTISSLGVCGGELEPPVESFIYGIVSPGADRGRLRPLSSATNAMTSSTWRSPRSPRPASEKHERGSRSGRDIPTVRSVRRVTHVNGVSACPWARARRC